MSKSIKLKNNFYWDVSSLTKGKNPLDNYLLKIAGNTIDAGSTSLGYYLIAKIKMGQWTNAQLSILAIGRTNLIGAALIMIHAYGVGSATGSGRRYREYVIGFEDFVNTVPIRVFYDDNYLYVYFYATDTYRAVDITILPSKEKSWVFYDTYPRLDVPAGTMVTPTIK